MGWSLLYAIIAPPRMSTTVRERWDLGDCPLHTLYNGSHYIPMNSAISKREDRLTDL
jgi:hypothetical protein